MSWPGRHQLGTIEQETTSGDNRVQDILVATRVPELPARDSPTRYGRTENGREGEREHRIGQDNECESAAFKLDGRVVRHTGAGCRRLHREQIHLLANASVSNCHHWLAV